LLTHSTTALRGRPSLARGAIRGAIRLDRSSAGAEDATAVAASPALSVHALVRSGLVLAGLLLLAVGLGNMITGRSKSAQYEEVLRSVAPARTAADPAALFPPTSEGAERHELALAKLAFYQLMLRAGRLLSLLGALLLSLGVLRLWTRAPRAPAGPARAN
jgi:hypothetical protein